MLAILPHKSVAGFFFSLTPGTMASVPKKSLFSQQLINPVEVLT
jgi:hypothetical protein